MWLLVKSPVRPYMVSSIGSMWIFVKFGTSPAGFIVTISPNLTLQFNLETLFILIF